MSLRSALAVEQHRHCDIRFGDISAAFLHAEINERVSVRRKEWKGPESAFWLLLRTLFGLRRSMKDWNTHFTGVMPAANFVQNRADPCLYSRTDDTGTTIVYVHVDDLLIVGTRVILEKLSKYLSEQYLLEDFWFVKAGRHPAPSGAQTSRGRRRATR